MQESTNNSDIFIFPQFSYTNSVGADIGLLSPGCISIHLDITPEDFMELKAIHGDKATEILFGKFREKFDEYLRLDPKLKEG